MRYAETPFTGKEAVTSPRVLRVVRTLPLLFCSSAAFAVESRPAPLRLAPETAVVEAKILDPDTEGCTWVESEGAVSVGDREHTYQAQGAAQLVARVAAMQRFLGTRVKSQYAILEQEELGRHPTLVEDMLRTNRSGRILKEEVTTKGYRSLPDCDSCRYYLQLRTCLVPEPDDRDKDFSVDIKMSHELFSEGEEAALEIVATRDCYIYLYDVGIDGETSLIVPNQRISEQRLKAGQVWRYPDKIAKSAGVRLVAQLPKSRPSVSAETIRVVATKVPLPASTTDPKDGGFFGVTRRMISSRVAWVEDIQQFTIYARK